MHLYLTNTEIILAAPFWFHKRLSLLCLKEQYWLQLPSLQRLLYNMAFDYQTALPGMTFTEKYKQKQKPKIWLCNHET